MKDLCEVWHLEGFVARVEIFERNNDGKWVLCAKREENVGISL